MPGPANGAVQAVALTGLPAWLLLGVVVGVLTAARHRVVAPLVTPEPLPTR